MIDCGYTVRTQSSDLVFVYALDCTGIFFLIFGKESPSALKFSFLFLGKKILVQSSAETENKSLDWVLTPTVINSIFQKFHLSHTRTDIHSQFLF